MMTDNDIKKALKCCADTTKGCEDCPFVQLECIVDTENTLMKSALDLINRQQAEIERLGKELIKQQLKNNMLYETAKEAKSEAIQEFAERLKEGEAYIIGRSPTVNKDFEFKRYVVFSDDIDHLAKEMTEEKQ